MSRHPRRAARATVSLFALALSAGVLAYSPSAFAWPGVGGDVTLDNFTSTSKDGDVFVIKHADFTNTNLSKEEIVKLLTPDTSTDDERALAQKLKADKISIPTIDITLKKGGMVHLHDFAAENVDSGKIAKVAISAIDGTGTDNGSTVTIKSGALRLTDADLGSALSAVGQSADAAQMGRIGALSWESVDLVVPDTQSGAPAKTVHIAFGSFELHNSYDGDLLTQGATTLKALVIEPSQGTDFAKNLADLGYSRLELGVVVGAHYAADSKKLTIDDMTLDGVQMGSFGLKANFGDIDPSLFGSDQAARIQAVMAGSISSLEIKLVNSGIFEKSLALYAKQQGATPDALKQQLSLATGQMLPLFLGGDASVQKVVAETQKFIADPKNLTVSIKAKDGSLKAADFMAISDPTALASKLDIAATANQ